MSWPALERKNGHRLRYRPFAARVHTGELMDRTRAHIRPYQPGDLEALYRICLLTGDDGRDATSLFHDSRLLGHFFAAPYTLFEPSLAFVTEDAEGVGGYIVGALDSRAFEEQLERKWWPDLRARYLDPSSCRPPKQWTADQRVAHMIHHPWRIPNELAARYPSHLHVNLLPRLQASGYGTQLINTLIAALRDERSRGVHLHVPRTNRRAAEFYRHVGFTELPATDAELPAAYLHLFGIDLRQPTPNRR
jgi:ribosomal protein S18 acetylase RimI-like enzyme